MIFTEYLFYNVNSHQTLLENLAEAAEDAGWVIDKIDHATAENSYLYLHSNGNGNQNLYYSFRFYRQSGRNNVRIWICGNQGFNTNLAWNNQPGKWGCVPDFYGGVVGIPTLVQRIYVHHDYVFHYTESYITDLVSGTPNYLLANTAKKYFHFSFGSFELYKGDYTYGNVLTQDTTDGQYQYSNYFDSFGDSWGVFFFLFENSLKRLMDYTLSLTGGKRYEVTVAGLQESGPSGYNKGYFFYPAVNMMTYTNKGVFVKNQVIVTHAVGGYTYRFPVAEFPIWMTRCYPYYEPGELVELGTRKFRILPILHYNSSYGYAIEIS